VFRPIFFYLVCFFLPTAVFAQTGFQTDAPHAVIVDAESGEVLFEKDARIPMAPASMTKIMTADIVFEALKDVT